VTLRRIEVVEDLTAKSRCDEGFLTLRRLRLRNVYADRVSEVYPCDVVSRPGSDAVVAVLYERDDAGRVHVLLREGVRPPVYLRKLREFHHPDQREYLMLAEVIAGLVEATDDPGAVGMQQRAAIEAREEAGCEIDPADFCVIGGETFASPGTSDEKVYYCAGPVRTGELGTARGDGTVMEEVGRVVRLELTAAIEACRRGDVPDMKTELALFRLCDHLGFIPQLGCYASELPGPLRARYRRLGIAPRA
jgi:ADP-ribose pyrophosphatase